MRSENKNYQNTVIDSQRHRHDLALYTLPQNSHPIVEHSMRMKFFMAAAPVVRSPALAPDQTLALDFKQRHSRTHFSLRVACV